MNLRTILGFLVGRADAIRHVASSKAAFWTGMALVLLTAFPRNYDQTYIPEKPVLWFLGPLLFSLVSGTWLFLVSYGLCARWKMDYADGKKPPLWSAWRGFMGAFWMTAPIAWIYAIPVERFWDSLTATKANLWLLGIVSLWRVLLMARVFQVVCQAPAFRCLLWVLLAAGVEVVALGIFGGGLERRVLAGMGGLRNSPEEELIFRAVGNVAGAAFWGVPISALILALWRWNGTATTWPATKGGRIPWAFLSVSLAAWVALAIPRQTELKRNVTVEQLAEKGDIRAALDFMNRHQPEDFARARSLPPKLYEWATSEDVPRWLREIRSDDAPWIHRHLLRAAKVLVAREKEWSEQHEIETPLTEEQSKHSFGGRSPTAAGWNDILLGLEQFQDGRSWRHAQSNLWLAAIRHYNLNGDARRFENEEGETLKDRLRLMEALAKLGYPVPSQTNSAVPPTP